MMVFRGRLHGVFYWAGPGGRSDPPLLHGFNELPQGDGVAGHLHAHVKALVNSSGPPNLFQVRLLGVHGHDAKLPGQLQPVFVEIRNHHMPRPQRWQWLPARMPMGPAPVTSTSSARRLKDRGGKGGIAEGIKDGVQLLRNLGGSRK